MSADLERFRRIAIGCDHTGLQLKRHLLRALSEDFPVTVIDCGCHSAESVDYPDIAIVVGRAIRDGQADCGIMIDGAGIGSTMALNRLPEIRAALCHDPFTTANSRAHNDANVLVLGSNVVHPGEAVRLLRVWLRTPFEGGRHQRRLDKIRALDSNVRERSQ